MNLNGHKPQGKQREYDAGKPVYALRVFRVEPGAQVFIRTLSDNYCGCMTHYKGMSRYCAGSECDTTLHKLPQYWKGYAAAELYDGKQKVWLPIVLEITEHLELDMRGIFARGQVWEVFRHAEAKKGEPVRGALHEQLDVEKLQPAFDVQPVLRTLYHWLGPMNLAIKNPLPPRVLVQPVADDAPQAVQEREGEGSKADYDPNNGYAKRFEEQMRAKAAKSRK